MIGVGMGLAAKGYIPFMATFAAFLTRAHDQVRMAAYSLSNIKICGSHVGVSIGEDGPSQMGLEDLAMFRPIPGCVVLYPSDAVSSEACVAAAAAHKGMCYIRTSRPATPLLYPAGEAFPIGGSKVLRKEEKDAVTVIAAGITVRGALKACDSPEKEAFRPASSMPTPCAAGRRGILGEVAEAGGRAVVVEDHYAAGAGARPWRVLTGKAALTHPLRPQLPRSGKPDSSSNGTASALRTSSGLRELVGRSGCAASFRSDAHRPSRRLAVIRAVPAASSAAGERLGDGDGCTTRHGAGSRLAGQRARAHPLIGVDTPNSTTPRNRSGFLAFLAQNVTFSQAFPVHGRGNCSQGPGRARSSAPAPRLSSGRRQENGRRGLSFGKAALAVFELPFDKICLEQGWRGRDPSCPTGPPGSLGKSPRP